MEIDTRMIKCIAIDDEPIALEIIRNFCNRKGGIELETYNEPKIGASAIKSEHPDLAFIDIEMKSLDGLEIAASLPEETLFIFTTAHAEYALEGFNLNAVDYLHKPIAYERFEQAIEKAAKLLSMREEHKNITVKQEYNNVIINPLEIVYIESMENYTKIYMRGGKKVVSRTTMKSIFEMLPKKIFCRVHKSYIINREHIIQYNKNNIIVIRDKKEIRIPVGRVYSKDFLNSERGENI